MLPAAAPPSATRTLLTALLLYLSVAVTIASYTVAHVNLSEETGPDVIQYVRMYEGVSLNEIPAPYRYRPLVPWIARLAPTPPASLMTRPENAADKTVRFRFALVNLLGLTCAAGCLFLMMRAMRYSSLECLLGGFLFLTMYFPIRTATLPLVDAWAYAFLAAGLLTLLHPRPLLLGLIFALGIFTKETILLSLSKKIRREKF